MDDKTVIKFKRAVHNRQHDLALHHLAEIVEDLYEKVKSAPETPAVAKKAATRKTRKSNPPAPKPAPKPVEEDVKEEPTNKDTTDTSDDQETT